MSYYTHSFEGPLSRFGVGKDRKVYYVVLFLPAEIETDLPFETYPRLRVEGEIADVPVRGAWIPTGDGRRYFIVSPAVRKATECRLGDVVEMRFKVDDQDYVDVPPRLLNAIEAAADLRESWSALTAGKQRMFAHHVGTAKTEVTEDKRIAESLEALRLGCTLRDLKGRKGSAKARP